MADVKNKTVNIYIDQSSAINALENLQKKADGFNKKIEEAREKQTQLLETIKKSETAASNIDALRKTYADLSKEIENNKNKLAENNEEKKRAENQLRQLGDRLIEAKDKQRQLSDEIVKAADAGKGTKRLELQYASVTKEIDRTIEKVQAESAALQKAAAGVDHFSSSIEKAKAQQKGLRDEIKLADGAVKTIKNAENEYKTLGVTIDANTKSAAKFTEAQKGIQDQIDKGLRPSFNQTKNLVSQLRNELSKMSEDAPGYAEKFEKFKNARTELDRLTQSMNGVEKAQKSWFQDAKTVAFGVLIGNTVQQAIGAIGGYLSGIVSGNAKLSDSLADIQRVAGLSGKEVEALQKKLSSFDTRTSVEQLRNIAIVAGKLGVAKEDIAGFTKSVDQLVVALGDELGDADQITTTLGKILNVFDGKVTGENILQLGNAFVVLANAGVASGGFIADFTQRVSGIAKASNLSLGATVGLGAGLEELGGKVESSSTAIQKVITTIGQDIPKAAKIAGAKTKQDIQDFANLFARAPEEALLKYAEGLTKNKSAFSEISASFKDAGEEGARTISTLIQLGEKGDFFRQKMDQGRKSLADTSAITDAFNLKNQTLGAEIEKLGKKFSAFITSSTLSEFFRASIHAASGFIDVLKAIPTFVANNRTALALLVVGIATMNGAYITAAIVTARDSVAKAYNAVVTRLTAAATTLSIASQAAYITITTLLTGRITLATAAQRLWNIALSLGAGPIGVIIVAAASLALVVGNLIGATKTLTNEQKLQGELQGKIAEDIGDQKNRTQELLAIAKNVNLEYGVRKQALDALIKQNPDYLSGLTLENLTTQKGINIIEDYISALDRMAKAKALRGIKEDLSKQRLSQQIDLTVKEGEAGAEGFVSHAIGNIIGTGANAKYTQALQENIETTQKFNVATEQINKEVSLLNFQVDTLQKKLKGLSGFGLSKEEMAKTQRDLNAAIKERNIYLGLSDVAPAAETGDVTVTTKPDKKADKAAKKEETERNKILEELRRFKEELERVGMQADDREIDRIEKKYAHLIELAKQHGIKYIALEAEKNRAIAYLLAQEEKARLDFLKKQTVIANDETYKNFISQVVDEGENKKDGLQKQYANRVITKKQLEQEIRKTDIETFDYEIQLAQSFAGVSKQAAEDVVKFKKQKNKETTIDAVKTREELDAIERREKTADAAVKVLKTQPETKGRLDALVNQLEVERDLKLKNEDLTQKEIDQINEEYRQKIAETNKNFYLGQIKQVLEFISSGIDIISKFNQAQTNKENAALKAELKNNDTKKAALKKLLDSKVITQQQYNKEVASLDKDADAKKEALEKKQFERNKKMQIAQALTNGALGITAILAAIPGPLDILSLSASRVIAIGLNIATTAGAIAEIASQKFADGGQVKPEEIKNGKITVASNIPTQPNGDSVLATVKPGEVILNEDQQRRAGGPAFFRSIGVPGFATGGKVESGKSKIESRERISEFVKSYNVPGFIEGGQVKPSQVQNQTLHVVNVVNHNNTIDNSKTANNETTHNLELETQNSKLETHNSELRTHNSLSSVNTQQSTFYHNNRKFDVARIYNLPGFATGGPVKPEMLKSGKITVAPNIPLQSNGDNVLATVKVGEVVLTPEQQIKLGGPEALRQAGVPGFATGGVVMKPIWKNRPYKSLDYQNISQSMQVVKFATGGVVGRPTDDRPQATVQTTDPALLEMIRQQQEVNLSLMNTVQNLNNRLEEGIEANVSLSKFDKAQKLKVRMEKDSQFK